MGENSLSVVTLNNHQCSQSQNFEYSMSNSPPPPDNPIMEQGQIWKATCEQAVKAIVSILMYNPRSFDTEVAHSGDATGFVVDAKRGIILTNRHVAGPGPFCGRCVFHNQEEVDVSVIYYDPIHDYGFLRFDPKALKRTTVPELVMRPDLAVVGMAIRVIGNDASQRLSISEGTISRVNRNAPSYSGYVDFNINYLQGSAMTSGGSSGSPVIDIHGNVVGLNAGSFVSASIALFLPLEHPLKSFQHLVRDEAIPRGTLQAKFTLKTFHECQALGLTDQWVTTIQQLLPEETGMLVVKGVLPGGPAESKIQEGDVLLKLNGVVVTRFSDMNNILDSNVLNDIEVIVHRGHEIVEVIIKVDDLHAITPDRYLMISTTTFHDFSFQQAQRYRIPVRNAGVFCSQHGFFGTATGGSLIKSVAGRVIKNLQSFIDVIQSIPDGTRVLVATQAFYDTNKFEYTTITLDRRLCWMELATRDFVRGKWIKEKIPRPPTSGPVVAQKANVERNTHHKYPQAAYIIDSIVWVTIYNPLPVDGTGNTRVEGYGLVLNEELGLVLVSRHLVTTEFFTCTVSIFGSIIIPGDIVFVHPAQNFAILRYDPSLVNAPVERARLSMTGIKPGDSTLFFHCNDSWLLDLSPSFVAGVMTVSLAPDIYSGSRSVNIEALRATSASGRTGSGLISEDGTVQALWLGEYCTTVASIVPVLKQIESGCIPQIRLLGARMHAIEVTDAMAMGLPEEWIERVEASQFRILYAVTKPYAGHTSGFEEGDVIVTLDDELAASPGSLWKHNLPSSLQALVLRDRKLVSTTITTYPTEKIETSRVIVFCGAVLQQPYLAVRQRSLKLYSDVFVAGCLPGSPFKRYGLATHTFITHVNGIATPNLDVFLKEVGRIEDNIYFRVTGMTSSNIQFVKTLKRDEHYFPITEYRRDRSESSGWSTVRGVVTKEAKVSIESCVEKALL